MTKSEFYNEVLKILQETKNEEIGTKVPSDRDFMMIETVYAHHPSISDTNGRRQVAELYVKYGMTAVKDMLPRAQLMKQKEEELKEAERQLKMIQKEIADIYHGRV